MLTGTQTARYFFSALTNRPLVRPVPMSAEPSLRRMAAIQPALPPPGDPTAPLKLADETLAYYGEQYLQFVAPWRGVAGAPIPNFYQFIVWQERVACAPCDVRVWRQ